MKKFARIFTALLLIASMLLTFCSCTKTEDASGIFTKAKKKTDSLKSFAAVMTIDRAFTDKDNKFSDKSTVNVNLDRSNEESPVYLNEYVMEYKGDGVDTKQESSTYFADSVIYQKGVDGSKYMQIATVESVNSQFSSVAIDMPAKAFEKSRVYKNDGVTQVVAEPKAKDVQTLLESFISGMETYFAPVDSADGFKFEYSTVSLSFDVNSKGYFEMMAVKFKATFAHSKGDAAVDMSITVDFIDPGKAVDVKAPDDLSEYVWYEDTQKTEDELQEEFMNEVFELYDENNNPVPEYDELYLELCAKYGKEAVDSIVETFELLKATQGK